MMDPRTLDKKFGSMPELRRRAMQLLKLGGHDPEEHANGVRCRKCPTTVGSEPVEGYARQRWTMVLGDGARGICGALKAPAV